MRQITLAELKQLAQEAVGSISHIYLHWSAGHYGSFFEDYHINIDEDGSVFVTGDLTELKSHTWRRNSNAVGVALACCYQGQTSDLGPEPPTVQQIESMAQVIAVLADTMGIPITAKYIMTHAEAADLDGYGPATTCERWDLAILQNGDAWMSGGDTLRGKAEYYLANGVNT